MRNAPCWCGSGKKWKKCHYPQQKPLSYDQLVDEYKKKYQITIKTPKQIEGIRKACQLSSDILYNACAYAKEGVTTNQINDLVVQLHDRANAIPAPLGYGTPPYPKAICTSLNEVICHGIPDDRPLQHGDIINIDITTILSGYYGDCSAMVAIGTINEEKARVIQVSYYCLQKAIAILKPGILLQNIGNIIEDYASSQKCSVVYQFVGHGTGLHFHEAPQVCHHYNDSSIPLAPGMIFTIEPMINAGQREGITDPKDQWTTRTIDKKPSAQWEHTVLITEKGHEILTFNAPTLPSLVVSQ